MAHFRLMPVNAGDAQRALMFVRSALPKKFTFQFHDLQPGLSKKPGCLE